jgi:hypothetical protein
MTHIMWMILRHAQQMQGVDCWVAGPMVRSANILARRGFLEIRRRKRGMHDIWLTEAGFEALKLRDNREGAACQSVQSMK